MERIWQAMKSNFVSAFVTYRTVYSAWAWAPMAPCWLSSTSLVVCLSGTSRLSNRGPHGPKTNRYASKLLVLKHMQAWCAYAVCSAVVCAGNILYIRRLTECINVISLWPECVCAAISHWVRWLRENLYFCWMRLRFMLLVCVFCFITGLSRQNESMCVCVSECVFVCVCVCVCLWVLTGLAD